MVELSLGLHKSSHAGSFKAFCFSGLEIGSQDGHKLQTCVHALEQERGKIEAFKRELPLCMQLITDAIEALKSHLQTKSPECTSTDREIDEETRQFEEFIPPSRPDEPCSRTETAAANVDLDKPNWMSQAQLWSQSNEKEICAVRPQAQRLVLNTGNSGAFSPFVRKNCSTASAEEQVSVSKSSSESPSTSPKKPQQQQQQHEVQQQQQQRQAESDKSIGSAQEIIIHSSGSSGSQRKARRSWSPELHRRFLNALEQLGGSQATPKLIREIMKVDGLTNDEVKSHLQKYRLHTRRPSQRPDATSPVVIWVPAEYKSSGQVPVISPSFYSQQRKSNQVESTLPGSDHDKVNPQAASSSSTGSPTEEGEKEPVHVQHEGEMDDGDVTEAEDSKGEVTMVVEDDHVVETVAV